MRDGGLVAEEGGAELEFYEGLAGGGLDRVDGYDAVFAGGDEGFGVGESEGGDLADVQVLEEAGGLGWLARAPSCQFKGRASHLPVVAQKEAHAIVGIPPLEELVIMRREVQPERRGAEQPVQLGHIDQRGNPLAALC